MITEVLMDHTHEYYGYMVLMSMSTLEYYVLILMNTMAIWYS